MSYQNQILGTIISSALNYDQLCTEMNENPAINNTRSSYAPCDGRDISGSQLDIKTNHVIKNTPDLRGRFLRGLNTIYNVGQPNFDITTADTRDDPENNRRAGTYQGDIIKKHAHQFSHVLQVGPGEPHNINGGFSHSAGGGEGYNNYGGTDQNPDGGSETRPKNVSVYFYIKIN